MYLLALMTLRLLAMGRQGLRKKYKITARSYYAPAARSTRCGRALRPVPENAQVLNSSVGENCIAVAGLGDIAGLGFVTCYI